MRLQLTWPFRLRLVPITAVLLLVIGIEARAQSSDARFPTPVSANEIVDSIGARDVGDSRLTDYFYTFTGLPGDLLITLDSKNLNGDIDVFTAGELRPLIKITFYAEGTTSASKNIYLRKRQSLILRIEARTPNDDPGTYRIRFNGSFEPISGGALEAESGQPAADRGDSGKTSDRKTTRVSSVGARIDEPAEEPTAAPTKLTPKATSRREPGKPAASETKTTAGTPPYRRPPPPRRIPTRTSTPSETAKDEEKDPASEPVEKKAVDAAAKPRERERTTVPAATDKSPEGEAEKEPESDESNSASTSRASVSKAPARKPARTAPRQPENRARLVIEQKDGTRREFLMSNVRKVTVENGVVVVEQYDGYTQRISMAEVARMSIGP